MARSAEGREKRKQDVRTRSGAPLEGTKTKCTLFGCGLRSMRAEGKGLSLRCRFHVQHEAVHGSPWKKTYTANELEPFRKTAHDWIAANASNKLVVQALSQFDASMNGAGRAEIATRLRGLKPKERAQIALARLREAKVPASRLLEAVLAVNMVVKDDSTTHRTREFRICQVAKACHKMASGYHRKWITETEIGPVVTAEIHKYPKSSGQVLRYLGTQLETCAEWVVEKYLADILAQKIKNYGKFVPKVPTASTPQPNPNFKRPALRDRASGSSGWR